MASKARSQLGRGLFFTDQAWAFQVTALQLVVNFKLKHLILGCGMPGCLACLILDEGRKAR